MGRAFEKVMENRRQLAETLRKNMLDGTIVGKNICGLCESPQNPVSQKAYRGVNRMTLILAAAERGYQDPRWMTFDQIKLQKYHLRKGSKGVLCEYWDFGQEKSDEAELQENMQQPKVGYYYVYNAADVEGIEPYKRKEPTVSEQNSIRSFIQSRLQVQERADLQRGIAQLFTEMEFGITEMVGISAEKEELPATGEIVRAIQQAQIQSEDIIFQYEKSLLQDSEFVEHVPIVLEERKESRGQEEPLESQGEYTETIRNDDIGKIEDFGKKIGGARKDNWKLFGLRVEDILDMTSGEREKYVTKDNIWKKPDYEAMMSEGLPKKVAWYIKRTRDKLISKPGRQEHQEGYIAFVQDLKNSIMNVKTEQDCIEFYKEFLLKKGYLVPGMMYGLEITEKCAGSLDNKLLKALRVTEFDLKYSFEREMAKAQFGVPAEDKLPPGVAIRYSRKAEKYMVYKGGVKYASCDSQEEAVNYAKENLCRSKVRKQILFHHS
ncbi:MAG: ArdC family protein [Lachnospiraceae bacterium]|nr:ArdC family protein [Lachnospiraceae bacterium]